MEGIVVAIRQRTASDLVRAYRDSIILGCLDHVDGPTANCRIGTGQRAIGKYGVTFDVDVDGGDLEIEPLEMGKHDLGRVHLIRMNDFRSGDSRNFRHSLELLLDGQRLLVFAETIAQFAQKRGDDRMFQKCAYLSIENGISSIEQSSVNRD